MHNHASKVEAREGKKARQGRAYPATTRLSALHIAMHKSSAALFTRARVVQRKA
jgi:hypothetical protein